MLGITNWEWCQQVNACADGKRRSVDDHLMAAKEDGMTVTDPFSDYHPVYRKTCSWCADFDPYAPRHHSWLCTPKRYACYLMCATVVGSTAAFYLWLLLAHHP